MIDIPEEFKIQDLTPSPADLPSGKRGGSNAYEQQQLLTSYGLRNDLIAG
jgi:hypothetical protein